jgi:hypothetical protein
LCCSSPTAQGQSSYASINPWRHRGGEQRSMNDAVEVSVPRSPSGKLLFDAVHSRRKLVKPLIGLLCGRCG